MTAEMHDHFRLLSRTLLDSGRVDEAALAFEAGRALAYAIETDRRYLERVVQANPFASDGASIDLVSLRRVQAALDDSTTVVSVAVLPPNFVAFVIDGDDVGVASIPMPMDLDDQRFLLAEVKVIPSRLHEREGRDALPEPVRQLATAIAVAVGPRAILSVAPYGSLHQVPWRAALRDAGLAWEQTAFPIVFGLLLREAAIADPLPTECIALGAGTARGGIDLGDEARHFAAYYPDRSVIVPCTSADVTRALRRNAIVLVSCHGIARDVTRQWAGLADGELVLQLADGDHVATKLIPADVRAALVILSACESGVYQMSRGDFPIGAAPDLIRAGSRNCIGARFPIDARFSAHFFQNLGERLASGNAIEQAFASACADAEATGFDLWSDIACIELIGRS